MPKKYRKKPVVIEALQVKYGETPVSDVADFMGISKTEKDLDRLKFICNDNDFIVKRVNENGCVSIMSAEAFEARYEPVPNTSNVTINLNVPTIRSETDIGKIAKEIKNRMDEELKCWTQTHFN